MSLCKSHRWPLSIGHFRIVTKKKKIKEVTFFGDTYDMYLPSQCINFLDVGINCIVHVTERLGATGYS